MATRVGKQSSPGDLINALIELDYDAAAAYEAAIERLDTQAYKDTMSGFLEDHRRHIVELTPYAAQFGKEPAAGPDLKAALTQGKVVIGNLMGDKAILMAMKTNEDDTVTAYQRCADRDDLPADLNSLMERNLADERRHRGWLCQTLGIAEESGKRSEASKSAAAAAAASGEASERGEAVTPFTR